MQQKDCLCKPYLKILQQENKINVTGHLEEITLMTYTTSNIIFITF